MRTRDSVPRAGALLCSLSLPADLLSLVHQGDGLLSQIPTYFDNVFSGWDPERDRRNGTALLGQRRRLVAQDPL